MNRILLNSKSLEFLKSRITQSTRNNNLIIICIDKTVVLKNTDSNDSLLFQEEKDEIIEKFRKERDELKATVKRLQEIVLGDKT